MNDFMSNGQPIVHHDINAYPRRSLGTGQAQAENDQSPGHNMLGHIPLQDSSNISSSPPESTPERPALANQSPEAQTTKSPTRSSGIGASDHRFACQLCSFSTNTKRDYNRHLRTRKHRNNTNIGGGLGGTAERTGFHCPVPDCKYSATGEMFSREDKPLEAHPQGAQYQEAGVIRFLYRPAAQQIAISHADSAQDPPVFLLGPFFVSGSAMWEKGEGDKGVTLRHVGTTATRDRCNGCSGSSQLHCQPYSTVGVLCGTRTPSPLFAMYGTGNNGTKTDGKLCEGNER